MKYLKKIPFILSILSFLTFFTSAFTGVIKDISDKIDKINGNFFSFFIISNLIGCYNITLCNNITFTSQAINELR